MEGDSVLTQDNALINLTWRLRKRFYYPCLTYYLSKAKAPIFKLLRGRKLPYNEMALIEFYRVWKLEAEERYIDENGVEVIRWRKDNRETT